RAPASGGDSRLGHVGARVLVEIGLVGDQPHVAAEGTLTEERALRPLQNLDVTDVEDSRIDGGRDRRVVDVEAGRAGGAAQILSGDAADADGAGIRDARRARAISER